MAGAIIDFTELSEFIERPVRTYSSGMKARLAFAMGAFINPDILIIDETLSVGDVFFAAKASRRMKEIAASGRIVILVIYGLNSVVEMCSRCLWFDRGRLVMDGDPKTVTQAYEASVRLADESELMRKFGPKAEPPSARGRRSIEKVEFFQAGRLCIATAAAMVPLVIEISCAIDLCERDRDLLLALLRVDGRLVWTKRLSEAGFPLPSRDPFKVCVTMNPFLLGGDLYRLDATILDQGGTMIDTSSAVIEVVDEEGQHGGKPLLYDSPQITARPIGVQKT